MYNRHKPPSAASRQTTPTKITSEPLIGPFLNGSVCRFYTAKTLNDPNKSSQCLSVCFYTDLCFFSPDLSLFSVDLSKRYKLDAQTASVLSSPSLCRRWKCETLWNHRVWCLNVQKNGRMTPDYLRLASDPRGSNWANKAGTFEFL